jgi:kynurenine 3-monooxygenase
MTPLNSQESQLYDPSGGQCINSLPRPLLNLRLIQALPTDSDRMKLRFETKLDRIDWRRNIAYARPKKGGKPGEEMAQGTNLEEKEGKGDVEGTRFDLVLGCDGSWSKVRQEMMKVERYVVVEFPFTPHNRHLTSRYSHSMDFSQSFIQHAYIELHMPPNEVKDVNSDAKFKIDQHHLHIWPRHSFMLIGLPNQVPSRGQTEWNIADHICHRLIQDGSFTLTLFAPFTSIEHLRTREQAEGFFQEHFPTALEWVGKDRLIDDFMKNPRGKLVTINVSLRFPPIMATQFSSVDCILPSAHRLLRATTTRKLFSWETRRIVWSPSTDKV